MIPPSYKKASHPQDVMDGFSAHPNTCVRKEKKREIDTCVILRCHSYKVVLSYVIALRTGIQLPFPFFIIICARVTTWPGLMKNVKHGPDECHLYLLHHRARHNNLTGSNPIFVQPVCNGGKKNMQVYNNNSPSKTSFTGIV